MPTEGEQLGRGTISTSVVPGEGTTVTLQGTLDLRDAAELEAQLQVAHRANPPVTVDLSRAVSIDSAIVDILAAASQSFAEGLRVVVSSSPSAHGFESLHLEHLVR